MLNFLERFITLGIKSFLVIYLIKIAQLNSKDASIILSVFFFWEYLLSMIMGKYIDTLFSDKHAVALGFLISFVGSILFLSQSYPVILCAIAFFNTAAAMIKPAIPNLLKNIIRISKDSHFDKNFLVVHMLTNIAAILGPLSLGFFLEQENIALIIGILSSLSFIGLLISLSIIKREALKPTQTRLLFLLFTAMVGATIYITLLNDHLFLIISVIVMGVLAYKAQHFYKKLNETQKRDLHKIMCVLILFFFYFLINIQKQSNLAVIIEENVNRMIWGFEIPTPWFISLIGVFVVVFSWLKSRSKKQTSSISNLLFGARIEAVFYILLAVCLFAFSEIPLLAIIIFYAGFSLSEIHISPITISYIAQKTPAKNSAIYFGLAPTCAALASYLNIFLSEHLFYSADQLTFNFGIFLLGAAFFLMLTISILRKIEL